ncbi:sugar-binding domain-containing protein [Promethearchaeum syntrophicum]|uniref:Sugar-binding domain-containing protein n=1 Tax=Promethearchaeum syntrophicum TaxID=2594042 RepID=A0A5B9D8P3_9ARCH|nr:sugar-binding domain-containing protein [Candidatus Prometheoarchaeum syntrophicum]QEE15433.1 beta-D-glucuronidase [Candidatus Prometheoarchaeum syntrophicum]
MQKFSLKGIWNFVLDHNNNGIEQNYHKQENQPYLDDKIKIFLPHCLNTEPQDKLEDYSGVVWYFKTFRIPPHFIGNKIYLHFDRIAQSAIIFINGKKVGKINGAFIPFEFDITEEFKDRFEEHFLAVRIDTSEESRRYPIEPNINEYYGIFGDVFVRFEEKIALISHFMDTKLHFNPNNSVEYAELSISLSFLNNGNEDYTGKINLELLQDNVSIIDTERDFDILQNNSRLMKIVINLENPELWSPENPNLYDLSMRVSNNLGTIIREEKTIGIREIGLKDDQISLNGTLMEIHAKPFKIDLLESGYVLPEHYIFKQMQELKNQGINTIYPNQGTFSPLIFKLASYFGFLILANLPILSLSLSEKSTFFKIYINDVNLEPCLALYTCNREIKRNAEINRILLSYEKLFLEIDQTHLFVNSENLRIDE